MPDIDTLMQEWPPEFEELLKEVNIESHNPLNIINLHICMLQTDFIKFHMSNKTS